MKTIEIIEQDKSLKKFNIYINGKKKSKKKMVYELHENDELMIRQRNIATGPLWYLMFIILVILTCLGGSSDDESNPEAIKSLAIQNRLIIKYDILKEHNNKMIVNKRFSGTLNEKVCFEFEELFSEKAYKRNLNVVRNAKIVALSLIISWLVGIALAITISITLKK